MALISLPKSFGNLAHSLGRKDSTGQHNKPIGKIIKLLAAQDDFNMKATMSTYIREWNRFS
eukprot:4626051-Ditylum_brightwellii.AAC.1